MTATGDPNSTWRLPSAEDNQAILDEARREIADEHELAGIQIRTCVSRCTACDEVALELADGSFALVHLSWRGSFETPPWPITLRGGGLLALELILDQHSADHDVVD